MQITLLNELYCFFEYYVLHLRVLMCWILLCHCCASDAGSDNYCCEG